jgi:hypothetical protein
VKGKVVVILAMGLVFFSERSEQEREIIQKYIKTLFDYVRW